MNHVAIDLGSRQSRLCVRSAEGADSAGGKGRKRELAEDVRGDADEPSRFLETSSEAFAVADLALAGGHEVSIVPSGLARNPGVGQR